MKIKFILLFFLFMHFIEYSQLTILKAMEVESSEEKIRFASHRTQKFIESLNQDELSTINYILTLNARDNKPLFDYINEKKAWDLYTRLLIKVHEDHDSMINHAKNYHLDLSPHEQTNILINLVISQKPILIQDIISCIAGGANPNALIDQEKKLSLIDWAHRHNQSRLFCLFLNMGAHFDSVKQSYSMDFYKNLIKNCHILFKGINLQDSDTVYDSLQLLKKYGITPGLLRNHENNTPLHEACYRHSYEIVLMIQQIGSAINPQNYLGKTPLLIASLCSTHETISLLLDHGAEVSIKDNLDISAWDIMQKSENLKDLTTKIKHKSWDQIPEEVLQLIIFTQFSCTELEEILPVNKKFNSMVNPLLRNFLSRKILEALKERKDLESDVFLHEKQRQSTESFLTDFRTLAEFSNEQEVIFVERALGLLEQNLLLISCQPALDLLEEAWKKRAYQLAFVLISAGIPYDYQRTSTHDIIIKEIRELCDTLFSLVEQKKSPPSIRRQINILRDKGIIPSNIKQCRSGFLILLAIRNGLAETVRLLLSLEANIEPEYGKHAECLKKACHYKEIEIIKDFIERGADVNYQDIYKKTALHRAVHKYIVEIHINKCRSEIPVEQHVNAVKILIKAGANFNILDANQDSPLHIAIRQHSKEIVKVLLEAGALIDNKALEIATTQDITDLLQGTRSRSHSI